MIGNTATIYASYMYPESSGPRYIPGGVANTVVCVVVAGLAIVLRFVHIRENKKLEKLEQEAAQPGEPGMKVPIEAAIGDRRVAGFRYIY